jgi:two-component system cell cycle sensor histidine kinase/response regulator CckA
MQWIRHILGPPAFEGEAEKTRTAGLAHTIAMAVATSQLVAILLPISGGPVARRLILSGAAIVISIGTLLLTHRGHVRAASLIIVIGGWILLTAWAGTAGGLHAPVFSSYVIPVMCAALLLGFRAAIWTTAATLGTGLFMLLAETRGLLSAPLWSRTPLLLLTNWVFLLVVVVVLLYLSTHSIRESLEQARLELAERTKAEEALRGSEAAHRLFFELDLAGNYISTPEGRLMNCNAAFARMFGFDSVEEAMNSGPSSVYQSLDARKEFLDRLKRHKRLEYFEEELRRKDGSVVHVIENVIGSFNESGELTEIRGYLMDDSERRRAEQQLNQSQKLEAIGRLAGGIAHDFNNVLTIILGYSQLLLQRIPRSDPGYGEASEVLVAGERAAALTSQLLAFSRKQILQPRVINLNEIVANLHKMLRRIISEDIDLVTVADPKTGPVRADPGQIEQVIINLAINARDAMPNGGRLTIETTNVAIDKDYSAAQIEVSLGPYVMLAVSDNGAGMDQEVQSQIFEPFFTTKEAGKGTGLGLSTVYGIVKQSGGNIWVYSEPGQGTTFKVYLPRADEEPDAAEHVDTGDNECRGTETVLLVEDETAVRHLAAKALRETGFTVLEASNGSEALGLIAVPGSPRIEILVTDVIMPGMSGKELADRVSAARPDIRVLFVTGYTDNAVVRQGRLGAGIDILQKPFTPAGLARKVRDVLDAEGD